MTQWGVDTLFNPGKRHMDEEKRRLQATRAEVGDNSGGKRIDLESGKVRISRSGTPSTPKDADDTATDEGAEDTGVVDADAVDADTRDVDAARDAGADMTAQAKGASDEDEAEARTS